ncbi:MAG: glycosyl hydrolase 53 family protein [Eubacteriales bacterium]
MKKLNSIRSLTALFVLCALLLSSVGLTSCVTPDGGKNVTSDSLYVEKVENLPEDFIMGMDASSVPSLEASGVKYYDYDGEEKDVYEILSENGVNYIRVRVWNDPFDSEGNGYGGGNCDINNAIEIGQRATKYGMKLLVNFHYSDFWADPAKQMAPKAWAKYSVAEKEDAIYEYTKECLQKLVDAGVDIGMVQIGNETNGYMCGVKTWGDIAKLMNAGSKAVREVCPEALVAVHFANPEKVSNYKNYAYYLASQQVDYDVFASSYYPFWHGTLENLSSLLSEIAETYDKKVMVAETSYCYTPDNTDFHGNTIGDGSAVTKNYPYTVQGQANLVRDVINAMANTTNGIGVFYWEGTWISVPGETWEEQSALWEEHGSGWASSYAGSYDSKDAGQYYGGCAVDNQAFFDADGKVLESLKVFALVRKGNCVENAPDAIEDVNIICDLNGDIVLPDTVNAVMLDNSKQALAVEWEKFDEAAIKAAGVSKHTIKGVAGGMTAHCYLSMVEYNFLKNWSFEDDMAGTGWTVNPIKSCDELCVENKVTDSMTGTNHYHFWGAGTDSVEFELEQTVEGLKAGTYKYSISIMGGDGGETDIYAYVKINGEVVYKESLQITVYNEWHTATIENIEYSDGDVITVGIYVKCGGAGNGAWGKIDDAMLNSVK